MADTSLGFNLIGRDVSASKTLDAVGKQATKTGGIFKNVGTIAAGVFGGNLMASAAQNVMGFAKDSINAFGDVGKEVIKLQRYTGGTAEDMSKLRFAAEETGISADTLAAGLGKMSKAAAAGSKGFTDLGISTIDASGQTKDATALFMDTAQKISEMGNGTAKTAEIMTIFGRAGMQLMPMLNKGKEGLGAFAAEAERFGLVLSGDNITAIKANIMAHREFDASVKGMQVQLGQYLYPAITAIMTGMTELVVVIATNLKPAFKSFGDALIPIVGFISSYVMPALAAIAGAFFNIPLPILGAVAAIMLLNSSLGVSLVSGITKAITGIVAMAVAMKANYLEAQRFMTMQSAGGVSAGIMATGTYLAAGAVTTLGAALKGVLVSMGPLAIGLAIAGAAMALFTSHSDSGKRSTTDWTAALYDQNGALLANAKAQTAAAIAKDDNLAKAAQFGITTAQITTGLNGSVVQMAAIRKTLEAYANISDAADSRDTKTYERQMAQRKDAQTILQSLDDQAGGLSASAAQAKRTAEAMKALGVSVTDLPAKTKPAGAAAAVVKAEFVLLSAAMLDVTKSALAGLSPLSSLGKSLGGDLVSKFVTGMKLAGQVTKDTVSAFGDMVTEIKGNFSKALGDATKQLDDAKAAFQNYQDAISGGISGGNELADAAAAQTSAIQAIADATKTRAEAQLALNDAVKAGDQPGIDAAKKTLTESDAALSDAQKKQAGFLAFMQTGADSAKTFADQIDQLRLAGASLEMIQQISALGAATGGRIISELMSGGADAIAQAKNLVATVADVGKQAGFAAATTFFQGGINAAAALVEGINSQMPMIQAALDAIGAMIAKAMGVKISTDIGNQGDAGNGMTAGNSDPAYLAAIAANHASIDFMFGDVPAFATGGIIPSTPGGQIVRVGEGGQPEAIVPLSQMGGMGGINVTVNVTGSVVQEQDLAVSVRDAIAQMIRRRGGNPAILGV